MAKLLPIIIILVAAIAGGGGGYFAKQMTAKPVGDEHASADDEHADEKDGKADKKKKKKKKKKGGKGKGGEEGDASDTVYMKFGRQFVVPIVKNGRPHAMMIMDINIEVDSQQGETIYAYEPRLRDALLSNLLEIAGEGSLPLILEDTEKMETVKQELLETARDVIGEGALQVLIQDIGIQNY